MLTNDEIMDIRQADDHTKKRLLYDKYCTLSKSMYMHMYIHKICRGQYLHHLKVPHQNAPTHPKKFSIQYHLSLKMPIERRVLIHIIVPQENMTIIAGACTTYRQGLQ